MAFCGKWFYAVEMEPATGGLAPSSMQVNLFLLGREATNLLLLFGRQRIRFGLVGFDQSANVSTALSRSTDFL